MAHFAIEDLTFSYPGADRKVLDGVTLSIERGSYVVLCGRSGCGKTTLLRHLKSVLAPHGDRSGRVLFCGAPLDEVPQRDQSAQIGFVMQNPDAQVVTDKVWHELAFGLESLGTDQRTMRLRVAEMASYFGIQNWFHKDVRDLSGGQKQLLNLASIMAMQPSVLVLDEPTSQLDPIAAADFLNTVRKINLELGTTVIITEHRLEDVFPAADQVVVMADGCVMADGPAREVGEQLYRSESDMLAALPAPMRICFGVRDGRYAAGERAAEDGADASSGAGANVGSFPDASDPSSSVPLTVREGRTWLTRRCESFPPACMALPEGDAFEEGASDCALELKDVWFRYGRDLPDILRGVSFEVPRGQLFAIVGGNGTGKSTTLKAIANVVKPYRGTVRVNGKKLKDWKIDELFRGCLAMLPQDPQNLFVKKTVREDLDEMLSGSGLSSDERARRVTEAAEKTGVAGVLDSHPFDLSGGEQQRAALSKVLLTEPRILLLDEPTKGIDNFFKQRLAEVFGRLKAEGVTIVMVSHDVEFCARYADTVSMFFDGAIVTTNTPRRFFSKNSFYTTAANRMSRHVFENAITDEDVIELCTDR